MAKSSLTWYKSKATHIINELRGLGQKQLAVTLNTHQSNISFAINNSWQKELERWLRLLDLAGYEIVEKEEEQ